MTLKQLETLYAVMRAGSITGAARELHVTQPAVSAIIKHAELQLGMNLFERVGGRLHPTPEALALEPELNEIFSRVQTVTQLMRQLRDVRSGRLVVAAPPTLVSALLPQALAALQGDSPRLEVSVHSLPNMLAVARVARREADIGVVYEPFTEASLQSRPLLESQMVCALPRGYPLARRRAIALEELANQNVISTGPSTPLGRLIEQTFATHGHAPPHVCIEVSSSLAACLIVSQGMGLALVDRAIERCGKFSELSFRPLSPVIAVSIRAIFPESGVRSRPAAKLLAVLQRQAQAGG